MGASVMNGDFDEPKADINVVPLIDVMLVLLIIFMVTAPMLQQGVEVNLPKATTAPLTGTNEQIVLSITQAGKIFLGAGNELGLDNLGPKVAAVMKLRKEEDRKIYIKADTGLQYGRIMDVMAALHQSGITQIGLVSGVPDERKKKEN